MTTAEAIETYDEVAAALFSVKNRKPSLKSQFKSSTMGDIVKQIVEQRSRSDLLRYQNGDQQKGKAFVCAVEEGELGAIHRFRTYDVQDSSCEWPGDCKVWEAARATTAAPLNLKPMTIQRGTTKKTFVDAALGYNNPTEQLLEEAGDIFHGNRMLGAIVSLGTGTRTLSLASAEDVNNLRYIMGTAAMLKNQTVDTERPHRRLEARFRKHTNTYFRFNLPNGAEEVGLADWKKMGELKKLTTSYVNNEAVNKEINDLVDVLSKKKTAGLTMSHVCRFLIISLRMNLVNIDADDL